MRTLYCGQGWLTGGVGKCNVSNQAQTNQAPRKATPGNEGEVRLIRLELKSLSRCRFGRNAQCRKIKFPRHSITQQSQK